MDEIEELPVEVLAGDRPAGAAGDRLMIGMAALVMVSALLIAVANLLGGLAPDGTATASPSDAATPSRTPRPTATPRPLRDLTVVPGTPQSPVGQRGGSVTGWLQATGEMAVVGTPTDAAPELVRLSPGDVVMVYQDWASRGDDGWLQTASPVENGDISVFGWIQLRSADGSDLGVFYPMDSSRRSGSVASLAAGPDGFLAVAWPPFAANGSIEPQLLASADGEHWEARDPGGESDPGGWFGARGPTGWLAASMSDGQVGTRPWIWESYDGRDWSPLGYLPLDGPVWVNSLVGSDLGYVLVLGDGSIGSRLWYSPDGITWQESEDPFAAAGPGTRFLGSDPLSVVAVTGGFVAWTGSYDGAPYGAQVAFSPNGRTWSSVVVDELEVGRLQVAGAGDRVIAIATMRDGSIRVWQADGSGGSIARLERDPDLEAGLAGASVESLFSDGTRAWALGFDRPDTPRLWSTDGRRWDIEPLPAGFQAGMDGLLGTAGGGGVVIVGARPTSAGDNPVFWHRRPDGRWVSEPSPVIPAVPDPSAAECGPVPSTAIGFAVLEPWQAVACHGSADMTFVAWSGPCEWCERLGSGLLDTGPAWLMDNSRVLLLSPVSAADVWYREVRVHPDLEMHDSWIEAWVRVTGHYADPAAEECDWNMSSGGPLYYHGAGRQAVSYCREQFVVTGVTVVDGPA